jgi:hypothetical protein
VAQGAWDARPQTPTSSAGLVNGLVLNNRGDSSAKIITPGDETHSMLLRRIQAHDSPRMPPLATNERDLNAERLLKDWIGSLK